MADPSLHPGYSLEPPLHGPLRALTQPTDGWQSLSRERPLPRVPLDNMPRDAVTKLPLTRRPVGTNTRPPKHSQQVSVTELEQLLDATEEDVKHKEAELQCLRLENAGLREEWSNTSASLAATRATVSHVLEDKHFESAWLQLRFDIKNWAITNFSSRVPGSLKKWFMTQSPPTSLPELSAYWRDYMKSEDHRPLLVQGFIWSFLGKHVFASQYKNTHVDSKQLKPDGAYWAFGEQQYLASLNDLVKPGKYYEPCRIETCPGC